MRKRTAAIAVGAALLALPGTAMAAASDSASCQGQSASNPAAPPGSKGAFVSQWASAAGNAFGAAISGNARCER